MTKPKVNSESQKQLDKAEEHFEAFDAQVKSLTLDHMNKAPVLELEPQTKLSSREANKADAIHLKPLRSINSKEPFNEKYRAEHTEAWKYVRCIVENNEIIGEAIELWTKRFAGDSAHFWRVPVNKPIYLPRHLAQRLSECKYHRLIMDQSQISSADGLGTYMGSMVVDQTKHRIDCREVGNSFTSMGF